jgi:ABC-2 type transport system permease protein
MHLGTLLNQALVTVGLYWVISTLGEATLSTLAALFFWQYASVPLSRMVSSLWEDTYNGAFEQTYLHSANLQFVFLLRTILDFAYQSVFAVVLFPLFAFLFGISLADLAAYPWWGLLLSLVLTLIGFAGLGWMMASVVLVYRKAVSYANVIEYLLLFLAGVVVPLEQLPGFLQALARWLPLTLGVETLRRFEAGYGVNATLPFLVVQSAALFLLGFVIFSWTLRRARARGFAMSR